MYFFLSTWYQIEARNAPRHAETRSGAFKEICDKTLRSQQITYVVTCFRQEK